LPCILGQIKCQSLQLSVYSSKLSRSSTVYMYVDIDIILSGSNRRHIGFWSFSFENKMNYSKVKSSFCGRNVLQFGYCVKLIWSFSFENKMNYSKVKSSFRGRNVLKFAYCVKLNVGIWWYFYLFYSLCVNFLKTILRTRTNTCISLRMVTFVRF